MKIHFRARVVVRMFEESGGGLHEFGEIPPVVIINNCRIKEQVRMSGVSKQSVDDFVRGCDQRVDGYGISVGEPQPDGGSQLALCGIQFGHTDYFVVHG